MDQIISIVNIAFDAATPLLIASLGLLVNERAGVINLGAEGTMLIAALAAFATGYHTGSYALAYVVGGLAGAVVTMFYAFFVIRLRTNQVATGMALSIFGSGASAFAGQPYVGLTLPAHGHTLVAGAASHDLLSAVVLSHAPVVYLGLVLCFALHFFFSRTRSGLVIRSVGDAPANAHALGYRVVRLRLFALLFGGVCLGVAGAYLSLDYTPMWGEGMTAGRGWIALALTTFAMWRPLRVLFGALLFGGVTVAQFYFQAIGVQISTQILAMLPYLSTIAVLIVFSRNSNLVKLNMPASLGKPFNPKI